MAVLILLIFTIKERTRASLGPTPGSVRERGLGRHPASPLGPVTGTQPQNRLLTGLHWSRAVAPAHLVLGAPKFTVTHHPIRKPNAEYRSREHLTEREVERLIEAAKDDREEFLEPKSRPRPVGNEESRSTHPAHSQPNFWMTWRKPGGPGSSPRSWLSEGLPEIRLRPQIASQQKTSADRSRG